MLVPSTFTGWYRKIMMKAEMASETKRSRAQTATTGRERAFWGGGAAIGASELPSDIVSTFYMEARLENRLEVRGVRSDVKIKTGKVGTTVDLVFLLPTSYLEALT
jgi:hypothetical protein